MMVLLLIMGRGNNLDAFEYLFIYAGAPIVNLDTFIKTNKIPLLHGVGQEKLLGAQTFKGIYQYASKWLHLNISIPSGGGFAYSNNGVEIGNVYTIFYKLLYDFGWIGCFILIAVMAMYYVKTYNRIVRRKSNKIVDMRVLLYAYLFNDLVMSAFSARFYETTCNSWLIRFLPVVFLLDYVVVEHEPIKNIYENSRK